LVAKLAQNSTIAVKASKVNVGIASVGVTALPDASVCKLWQERRDQRCWERETGRGSYTARHALHSQERLKVKWRIFSSTFEKKRRGF
jgi:hypothetical protein